MERLEVDGIEELEEVFREKEKFTFSPCYVDMVLL